MAKYRLFMKTKIKRGFLALWLPLVDFAGQADLVFTLVNIIIIFAKGITPPRFLLAWEQTGSPVI